MRPAPRPEAPSAPAPAARGVAVLALAALLSLAACEPLEPTFRQRTARDWAARLWSRDAKEAAEASSALVAFGEKAPDAVRDALVAQVDRPPPLAAATPFALGVDVAAARRRGLPAVDASEVFRLDVPVLVGRAAAMGLPPLAWRQGRGGEIEGTVPADVLRPDLEHLQAVLATDGALELRTVLQDPAGPVRPGVPAGMAYRGEVPYATRLAAEAKRWLDAEAAEAAYVPETPRVRAVPLATAKPPTGPEHFLLVEEPAAEADALDGRIAAAALVDRDLLGRPFLVLEVRRDRIDGVRRALAAAAGASVAVLWDGVVRAVVPAPVLQDDRLALPLWREATDAASREAMDMGSVLSNGRLPRPLRPLPLPPHVGVGPPPDNPVSRALAALGAPAVPALERLAASASREWTRRCAAWALERIRSTR